MYDANLYLFNSLISYNIFERELFQNTIGQWVYFDKDKNRTNDIKKAKYQKWQKK